MKVVLERLKRMLTNNWGLKLASLFIAIVIWFVVALVGDPQDTRSFNNISVKLTNTQLLDDQNKIYEIVEGSDKVRVYVTAPTSVFQTLRAEDIIAEADVSKLTDINSIAINFYTTNTSVDGVSFEGDNDVVYLNVEDRESKWIRVSYQTVGTVADGYVIGSTTADQTVVNISGPASMVSQVSSAYAELNVDGATNNVSANVEILLRDKDGNVQEFSRVEKNTDHILVSANVLATKEVPIKVEMSGKPAEGYVVVGDPELSVEKVTIAGSPSALSNINKITIPAERIDVTDAEESKSFLVSLREYLPSDVRLTENDFNGRVTISVTIKASRERNVEVPVQNISLVGVPENIKAEIVTGEGGLDVLPLRIYGLRETVNAVRAANITGKADVTAWMNNKGITELTPGEYEVPVTYDVISGVTIVDTGKIVIRVSAAE